MLELIGRYQVQEKIGEGAMADVYRAYDPSIRRPLAIKLLKEQYGQDQEYASRFLREAKAAGALSHPNIVTIYDVGETDGHPYIVMELLEGEPLNELMAREGRLPAARVMAIASQLADALSYAHGLGVIHRDIKPSNIMVAPGEGQVKILDFGIARVNETDGILDAEHLKTRIGQVLGTPRYMSPEQALGQEIDGRSDLFSVGVVMYEMITGKKAFGGASAATLALQITNEDPEPIANLAPGTARGLQFIVNKLLAKKPDRRFASGRLLLDALARERASHATAEEELKSKRYLPLQVRVTAMMAAVTAAILALTVGTVVLRQDAAMRQMAITTGTAMASFVANNAALNAADNATLPSDKQDWLPVQGFVQAAAADKNILDLKVIDASGVIRSASDQANLGKPFSAPLGDTKGAAADKLFVSDTAGGAGRKGLRFIEPITYGGRTVGRVDLSVSSAELQATSALTHVLLTMLALVVLGVVVAATYIVSRALAGPLKRLKTALEDGATGDLSFRISHNRTDEFGELFDAFNRFSGSMQDRLDHVEAIALPPDAAPEIPSPQAPAEEGGPAKVSASVFQAPPPAPEAAPRPEDAPAPLEATASKPPRRRRPKLATVEDSALERSAPPPSDPDRTVIETLNDQKAEG